MGLRDDHPRAAPPHRADATLLNLRQENARLRQEHAAMLQALRRFANDDNWHRKELSTGPDVVTWALGFDPAAYARSAINEKKAGDR